MPPDEHNSREDHRVFTIQIDRLERDLKDLGEIMREGFANLERKLDERLGGRDKRLDEHDEVIQSMRDRLRTVEVRQGVLWILMITAFGALAPLVVNLFTAGSGL